MPSSDRVLLKKIEYAAHRGVTPQRVSQWVALGKLKVVNGKIDRDASDEFLDKTREPKGKFGADRDNNDPADREYATVADLKIRREKVQLAQAEMEYERAAGKLCVVDRATKVIVSNISATVQILQRMPDRTAARIAAVTGMGEREVRDILRVEISDLCKEIAALGESFPESLVNTEQ